MLENTAIFRGFYPSRAGTLSVMTKADIHPTAVVSPNAVIADGCVIGPYAIIHDHVEIGSNTHVGPHVVIHDYVRMGSDNRVHAHAVLGDLPQDISFDPATETWVEIGDNNTLREAVSIHRATAPNASTRLGSNCYLMVNTHIGHDCSLGDGVILTINTAIGGHVEIGNNAVIGGSVVAHQFCRIGRNTMVAGFIAIRKDVLPFTMIAGAPPRHYRLNTVGLRRAGITGSRYRVLEQAYRAVREGDRLLNEFENTEEIQHLRDWLAQDSKRGLSGFLRE
ncbi:MAG: acyl-ACP--UDP-N-acetylglucosamine O-acyltransferase [Thiotrichales bacterium]|nr:MAG: acyl-ACP--UDP-N-acetylglucosamine O-acyltransferase [Thiotrichales bacterium]